jgi:hypothetical protein
MARIKVNIDGTLLSIEYSGRGDEVEVGIVTCKGDIGDLIFNVSNLDDKIYMACVMDSYEPHDDTDPREDR